MTFPVLAGQNDETGQFEYLWMSQHHSVAHYPSRWDRAVTLALLLQLERRVGADEASASGLASQAEELRFRLGPMPLECPLPGPMLPGQGGTAARCCPPESAELSSSGSWWTDPGTSLYPPGDCPLLFEWRAEATYLHLPALAEAEARDALSMAQSPSSSDIDPPPGVPQALIHADGSVLRTRQGGAFLEHLQGSRPPRLFSAEHLPPSLARLGYPLPSIGAHLALLRGIAERRAGLYTDRRRREAVLGEAAVQRQRELVAAAEALAARREQEAGGTSTSQGDVLEVFRDERSGVFTAYRDGGVTGKQCRPLLLRRFSTRVSHHPPPGSQLGSPTTRCCRGTDSPSQRSSV